MENITLGEIAKAITLLGVIIGVIISIYKTVRKAEKDRETLGISIKEIKDGLNQNTIVTCRNYLIRFLHDKESGKELSPEEIQNAYDNYELYRKSGGNSYIEHKWNKVMEGGR